MSSKCAGSSSHLFFAYYYVECGCGSFYFIVNVKRVMNLMAYRLKLYAFMAMQYSSIFWAKDYNYQMKKF